MRIEKREIVKGCFFLLFESQKELASTFLRFQEYYESPEFKDKIFTLEQFKSWYIKNSPKGKETGEFTYYEDWNGFNIPSKVLKAFYESKFNPLSNEEKQLLDLFKNEKNEFYIIAAHKNYENREGLINHELAHYLFLKNEDYKKKILEILNKFDTKKLKKELDSLGGYNQEVIDDEVQAHCISSTPGKLKTNISKELIKQIQEVFNKYKNNI